MKHVRLGVLVSGRGSNLQAIIDNIEKGMLSAEIAVVISDQADAYALKRARSYNIAAVHISAKGYKNRRDEYDTLLVRELAKHRAELICLAGFMRIITPTLIKAYPNRIMNIHPALLPSFPGLHVQKAAIEHGVKFSGCTVHFVDEGIDTGPIIIQAVVPVLDKDTEDSLSQRILLQEHKIYSRAIQLYAEGRLYLDGSRVLVNGGRVESLDFLMNP
ncbi:MAG TPA: phosphoribosylglycinamide formyltransferase [Nitrospirota bacterium]|nr:phosphoribosylglycinamide formyltransferase [Nitrospirota bacterium]